MALGPIGAFEGAFSRDWWALLVREVFQDLACSGCSLLDGFGRSSNELWRFLDILES